MNISSGSNGDCPGSINIRTGVRHDGMLHTVNSELKTGNQVHADKYLEKTLHKFLTPVVTGNFR